MESIKVPYKPKEEKFNKLKSYYTKLKKNVSKTDKKHSSYLFGKSQ